MADQKWAWNSIQHGWFIILDQDKKRLANVEREDHARLMAAAPDLVNALESVLAWLDSGQADDSAIYQQVKSALTLARNGGTNDLE